jgi:predicted house-cleaning noncanonical NTP pyrophosphatase (MazG superfamily)
MMPKFHLNKLVRDKLLESYLELNQKPNYRTLERPEHIEQLIDKVAEEIREIKGAPTDKLASEIADVQEALDSLKRLVGVTDEDVQEAQRRKRAKAGSFDKGVFIHTLDLENDDEWVNYYRREPERFPES